MSLCCARPGFYARGLCPEEQLARLDAILHDSELVDKTLILLMHYATRNHDGSPYDVYYECLANSNAVEAVISAHGGRIRAIFHGHVHQGYSTLLQTPRGQVPVINPGSSGLAWNPKRQQTAHFNIVELDGTEMRIERHRYNGDTGRFEREPGEAFSSGW